ncbi:uncharacterized protein [Centruroides vittatus]|uniref:uncharacterized protein n=1 Tax=Centruroides vittatus TaxID=120091 RepID=UPI00350F2DEE
MDDQRIRNSTEIKYLGIVLDNKMTWKNHVYYIYDKTVNTIHSLASIARNKWGYDSKACRLLYTAVIEPMITYGCEIWGEAVTKTRIKRKLLSAQRKSAISITKSYRTAPTDSTLVIANLPSIDLIIIGKVWQFLQLKLSSGRINRETYNRETEKIGVKEEAKNTADHIQKYKLDKEPQDYAYHPSFTIDEHINLNESAIANGLCIFTDGSKSGAGVGSSIVVKNKDKNIYQARYKLQNHCTANQAESYAIYRALNWINENRQHHKFNRITIYSDSRVALHQIKNMNIKLIAVRENINILKHLRSKIRINLNWIKGHAGTQGNERADLLARSAPNWTNDYNYSYTPITWLKKNIKEFIWQRWQKRWDEGTTGRITHEYIPDVKQRNKFEHLIPNFNITQLLTGHGNFRNYLRRFIKKTDGMCQCPLQEADTPQHIIYLCPNFTNQRKILRKKVNDENELWPCELKKFINNKKIYAAFKEFAKTINTIN